MFDYLKPKLALAAAFALGGVISVLLGLGPLYPSLTTAWADLPTADLADLMLEDLNVRGEGRLLHISSSEGYPYLILSFGELGRPQQSLVEGTAKVPTTGKTMIFGLIAVEGCEDGKCTACRKKVCVAPRLPPFTQVPAVLLNLEKEQEKDECPNPCRAPCDEPCRVWCEEPCEEG